MADYPTAGSEKEERRSYKDEAAAELYREAGIGKLLQAQSRMGGALTAQAEKLETFHSTPFSEQNVGTIKVTLEAIERTQRVLEEWHWLVYPNQRPTTKEDD